MWEQRVNLAISNGLFAVMFLFELFLIFIVGFIFIYLLSFVKLTQLSLGFIPIN